MADWWLTKDGDKSCLELYRRHYSAKKAYKDGRQRFQFVGPGYSIVLRTARADALFVWRDYIDDTIPKQEGIECAVFRNETSGPKILSSKLIRQADAVADFAWPGERHYTKVDPEEVGSGYPGWCFFRAGWRYCGETQGGKLIMERTASMAFEQAMKRIPDHLYWMMAKGRLRPTEPLFAVQLIDAESHIAIAEAEAETLPAAIDAAIDRLPAPARS